MQHSVGKQRQKARPKEKETTARENPKAKAEQEEARAKERVDLKADAISAKEITSLVIVLK